MDLSIDGVVDLEDLRTEMHFVGFGAASSAYFFNSIAFGNGVDFISLGTFLAIFFPLMYAFEIGIDELKDY
ncbi:MAG: hypothetical protein ABEJ98_03640 [Candidatus Nanohaloarchaea archaeon]